MSRASIYKLSLLAVALLALSLSGCLSTASEELGSLTGTLKSKGKACGDCLIAVFNTKTLKSYGCKVEESGTFELNELPLGEYQVSVVQEPTNDAREVFDKRIPKKYRNKSTSGLNVSITSTEAAAVLNIDME